MNNPPTETAQAAHSPRQSSVNAAGLLNWLGALIRAALVFGWRAAALAAVAWLAFFVHVGAWGVVLCLLLLAVALAVGPK